WTMSAAPAFTSPAESAAIKAMSESVEPRACADEHATHEPIWPVVAVRRASIRIVIVISVGADRRRSVITITGSHPDSDCNLCVRLCYRDYRQNRQQSQILNRSHCPTP